VRRLCGGGPAPCCAHPPLATHWTRPGPALAPHAYSLHNCCTGQPVQGSYPPPSPEFLPCQSPLPPGHHLTVRGPGTGGQHVVSGETDESRHDHAHACEPCLMRL